MSDELDLKTRFASELLKTPDNPYRAASVIFPDDKSKALSAARLWPNDIVVQKATTKLLDELGEMNFLPSKADAARIAMGIAQDEKQEVDDRLKALRLYSDIRGFIDKQGTVINNNVLTSNKVMLVRDTGSNEDWEQKTIEQQARLLEDANRPRPN